MRKSPHHVRVFSFSDHKGGYGDDLPSCSFDKLFGFEGPDWLDTIGVREWQ